MKRALDEKSIKTIYKNLLERFGEPISKAIDVEVENFDSKNQTRQTNHVVECSYCGNIPSQINEGMCCDQCGMMSDIDEAESSGRHPGHASSCTCPDCSRPESDD